MVCPSNHCQSQARLALLAIDDIDTFRYKPLLTQPNEEERHYCRRVGKENMNMKKQALPKLNNSKEELKEILRRLQDVDHNRIDQRPPLQVLRSLQNEPMGRGVILKSCRNHIELHTYKNTKKLWKAQIRNYVHSPYPNYGQQVHFLIRKNNYSANALNLKTLNILQELNSKKVRCVSSIKRKAELPKPSKRNMVAFLRKVG